MQLHGDLSTFHNRFYKWTSTTTAMCRCHKWSYQSNLSENGFSVLHMKFTSYRAVLTGPTPPFGRLISLFFGICTIYKVSGLILSPLFERVAIHLFVREWTKILKTFVLLEVIEKKLPF